MEPSNYNWGNKPVKVKIAEEFKASSTSSTPVEKEISFNKITPFVPIPEIKVIPDPSCSICTGSGHMREDGENDLVECLCVLKKRAQKYLSPHYINSKWDHSFDPIPYKNKNILLQEISIQEYKNIMKSFLLSSGMLGRKASEEIKYQTVPAYQLLIYYFSNSVSFELSKLETIPFVVIPLCTETPNKLYGIIIQALIEKRIFNNLPTWIYSSDGIDSDKFIALFGKKLTEFIKENFEFFNNKKINK